MSLSDEIKKLAVAVRSAIERRDLERVQRKEEAYAVATTIIKMVTELVFKTDDITTLKKTFTQEEVGIYPRDDQLLKEAVARADEEIAKAKAGTIFIEVSGSYGEPRALVFFGVQT